MAYVDLGVSTSATSGAQSGVTAPFSVTDNGQQSLSALTQGANSKATQTTAASSSWTKILLYAALAVAFAFGLWKLAGKKS